MFQKLPTQLQVLLLQSNFDLRVSYFIKPLLEKFHQCPFVYHKNFTCIMQHRRLHSPCPFILLGFLLSCPMDPFSLRACMLSRFSQVRFFVTLWTVDHHIPLSVGFSRQEYWSGLPCSPPEDLPDPAIKPVSPESPTLAGGFFMTNATREALPLVYCTSISHTV